MSDLASGLGADDGERAFKHGTGCSTEVLSSSSHRRGFNVCWIHWEAPPASSLQP